MKTSIGQILNMSKLDELRKLLLQCREAVVVCHLTPDGDAMGSILAMKHLLTDLGKHVTAVTPDMPPKNLMKLPGANTIKVFSNSPQAVADAFASADLVVCLDFNAPKRIDQVAPLLLESKAVKVLIDHHLDPEDFADLTISEPEKSSTCILLYQTICDMGWRDKITRRIGECIYTGMMTDTGNFSYNSNHPELYTAIAHLVSIGVDKDRIYSQVLNSNSINRLRLNGYALSQKMQVFESHRCALIALTLDELNSFGYERGDTEGLVNKPLSVPSIIYSVFFRQEKDYIKVSTRSKGNFPVNELCADHFCGGGHLNAAGGEFPGTMEQAIEKLIEVMPLYDKYLETKQE